MQDFDLNQLPEVSSVYFAGLNALTHPGVLIGTAHNERWYFHEEQRRIYRVVPHGDQRSIVGTIETGYCVSINFLESEWVI